MSIGAYVLSSVSGGIREVELVSIHLRSAVARTSFEAPLWEAMVVLSWVEDPWEVEPGPPRLLWLRTASWEGARVPGGYRKAWVKNSGKEMRCTGLRRSSCAHTAGLRDKT